MNQTRVAPELHNPHLHSVTNDTKECCFSRNHRFSQTSNDSVFLLPAFNASVITYRDRSISIPSEPYEKQSSRMRILEPVIVVNGQAEGLWKRTIQISVIQIEIHPSSPLVS
jgi:hypothetical protein